MARHIAFVGGTAVLLVGGCAVLALRSAGIDTLRLYSLFLLCAGHAAWLGLERRSLRWAAFGALLGPPALCAHWTSRHGSGATARTLAYLGLLSALLIAAQWAVERLWVFPGT